VVVAGGAGAQRRPELSRDSTIVEDRVGCAEPQELGTASPLETPEWLALEERHRRRVSPWVAGFRDRRARGASHPVHDFLFRYYRHSPGKLAEWHPDVGTALRDSPEARERFGAPHYVRRAGTIVQDASALRPKDRVRLRWIRDLLEATSRRPPNLGCFGMHEWAMVYGGEELRHREIVPLRLRREEVDAFVEGRPLVCSHYDAYRFFSPAARPLNRLTPSLSLRKELEQPGCVHANMDLYKWSYKSMPWIGSERLWQSFELAQRLRALDMRASPYDLTSLGYDPVPVETEEGRRTYRREQLALSRDAGRVRHRLIEALGRVLELADGAGRITDPPATATRGSA